MLLTHYFYFLLFILSICSSQEVDDVHLKAVIIEQVPFVMKKSPSCVGNDCYEGFIIDLFDHLLETLNRNITYEVYVVPDGQFGAYNRTSQTWTGIVGELENGNANLALAPLTITADRLQAIDFSAAYLDLGLEILIKKPEEELSTFAFLRPFEGSLWVLLIVTMVLMSVVVYVVDGVSPYGYRRGGEKEEKSELNIDNTVLTSMLTFVGQSGTTPRSWSARLLSLTYLFFTMIIIATYTANLTAFLTVSRVNPKIKSLEDLRLSRAKFAVLRNSAPASYFEKSVQVSIQSMRDNMIYKDDLDSAVNAVRNSEVEAFIHSSPILDYIVNQPPCDSLTVGELFAQSNYGIPLEKNSSFNSLFSIALLNLRETGMVDLLYKKWYFERGSCAKEEDTELDADVISISEVQGLFYLLLIFLGFSLAILLIEVIFYAYDIPSKIQTRIGSKVPLVRTSDNDIPLDDRPVGNK